MKIPFYQVDAFSKKPFGGNPAGVCVLDSWLDIEILQNIAEENNLSETAFLVSTSSGNYDLKWFTPTVEIDLCGHATLASGFILFKYYNQNISVLNFNTASGMLSVERSGELLSMDFPSRPPVQTEVADTLIEALGAKPMMTLASRDLLAVFENEDEIIRLSPDFERLKKIREYFAVIVTAPGDTVDFVSRFFAPNAGVDEDPVTGSAHCTLIPYWAERLNKNTLHASQLSSRKGELFCELIGDRVKISGHAILFAKGEIYL